MCLFVAFIDPSLQAGASGWIQSQALEQSIRQEYVTALKRTVGQRGRGRFVGFYAVRLRTVAGVLAP